MLPDEVVTLYRRAKRVAAFTGAGISEESGIPTFRGDSGLWVKYPPEKFASVTGLLRMFITQPDRVVDFAIDFYRTPLMAEPNPAHYALAEMERTGKLIAVITQNVDNLHQRAGSKNVLELHGNMYRLRCMRCGKHRYMAKDEIEGMLNQLQQAKGSRIRVLRVVAGILKRCECGGRYRVDMVFFGEPLPQDVLFEAERIVQEVDLLFVIGTSGVVYPAASLPYIAKDAGTKIIEINPVASAVTRVADHFLQGRAGEILAEFLQV